MIFTQQNKLKTLAAGHPPEKFFNLLNSALNHEKMDHSAALGFSLRGLHQR